MGHPRALVLWALSALLASPWTAVATNPALSLSAAFKSSSQEYGVPEPVLLAVSYAETRWEDHNGQSSTSGGYGPMHLTNIDDTSEQTRTRLNLRLQTLRTASDLTGIGVDALRHNPAANVAGGAALLASYQRALALPVGVDTPPSSWYRAVARYSRTVDDNEFADYVFDIMASGIAPTTTSSGQRISLSPVAVRRPQVHHDLRKRANQTVECPSGLDCIWLPAPYAQYGAAVEDYGNHDVANRPSSGEIKYIIIHDTEEFLNSTLNGVQSVTYLAWQYTISSADGQVWQHLEAKDIGWQAGNWYINMHSIGIEHEGFASKGATWFTESMYRSSAKLVKYLAAEHDIPLDRAHIIGHDQVPALEPSRVPAMHWDPGPFWDWEHYFDLLGAPIASDSTSDLPISPGSLITIKPGFVDNVQPVTGCDSTGVPCAAQGTNFIYLRQAPNDTAPLVVDIGLHSNGSPSTTALADIGARLAAGSEWVVAERAGDWVAVWYLGALGWFRNPASKPVAFAFSGRRTVTPKANLTSVPVYGRAYPEKEAYPTDVAIPYQALVSLQYSIGKGQSYIVADEQVQTDYYYAKSFNVTPPADHVQIVGSDVYYQIWFGHRVAYVRAADVE